MSDFIFTDDMVRAALRANGWARLKNNKWYKISTMAEGSKPIPSISVDRDMAFKVLLRDKNIG